MHRGVTYCIKLVIGLTCIDYIWFVFLFETAKK